MFGSDIFSKREARASDAGPEVYSYDEIPQRVRVQIIQIVQELIGDQVVHDYASHQEQIAEKVYTYVRDVMRREIGVFELESPNREHENWAQPEVVNFFLACDVLHAVDIVEQFCKVISIYYAKQSFGRGNIPLRCEQAIGEINFRLREAAIGYEFIGEEIVRVDSQFLHREAVVPALVALRQPGFKGSEAEFMKAHEHYRHGRYSEVLVECYKAFESILKAICAERGWILRKDASASALVDACINNGLIPSYWQAQFSSLRGVLETAITTPRNKIAAHGSGSSPVVVPEEVASYVLHMTASTILFLSRVANRSA